MRPQQKFPLITSKPRCLCWQTLAFYLGNSLNVGSLTLSDLRYQLRGDGLRIRTGPFVFCLHSSLENVAQGLHHLYSDFVVEPADTFADFHARIRHGNGIRRYVRPQSVFDFDGIEPFKPLALNQAFALLEWSMNWCIYSHAHNFLIIHGAVLERNQHALILPAPSGSGKSTLCGALMHRGWRLLSDELILIDPDTGLISPLARPVSLKNESIDVLRKFSENAEISAPIHDTAKGSVAHMKPTRDSVMRATQKVLPRWVVFPKFIAKSKLAIKPLGKPDVFMELVNNAFNYSILRERGFEAMAALTRRVDGLSASYGSLEEVIHYLNQQADEKSFATTQSVP